MRRTRMKKLALLLSLPVLGALGLVGCGGGDDEDSATEAKVSPDTTTATARPDTRTEAKLPPHIRNARLTASEVQELKLSREQVQELRREANTEAKLSGVQVQELKREANTWARHFSRRGACDRYMGQPICMRLDCLRDQTGALIENCTQVLAAFQKSFADATVEDIKSERILLVGWYDRPLYEAAVKFSNGEVVVFAGTGRESYSCSGAGSGCTWNMAEPNHNRRFLAAATPRK